MPHSYNERGITESTTSKKVLTVVVQTAWMFFQTFWAAGTNSRCLITPLFVSGNTFDCRKITSVFMNKQSLIICRLS